MAENDLSFVDKLVSLFEAKLFGFVQREDKRERRIKHYSSSHQILLVGEGDFSFSASLAQAFGSAINMVATSLDSPDFLFSNYENAASNIFQLQIRGCKVMHEVDATKMADHRDLRFKRFDKIIFNFPHADYNYIRGASRSDQLKQHRKLVRQFFENAKRMLKVGGEVHVTHKTNNFHIEWKLEELASESGLRLIEKVKFKLEDYPGYSNKYGFKGNEPFNCNPSKTYKFGH